MKKTMTHNEQMRRLQYKHQYRGSWVVDYNGENLAHLWWHEVDTSKRTLTAHWDRHSDRPDVDHIKPQQLIDALHKSAIGNGYARFAIGVAEDPSVEPSKIARPKGVFVGRLEQATYENGVVQIHISDISETV